MSTPKLVIIVPFRDRDPHKVVFMSVMPKILEGEDYKILFIHQKDKRPFNRGAVKNIGLLYVKSIWPESYRNITLVFHDIDFMPYMKGQFNYHTQHGVVKHLYGFEHTLGGIFSIKAGDFERINGFPNIWVWGLEDNILLKRWQKIGGMMDRSQFLHATKDAHKMIGLWHGWDRLADKAIAGKYKHDTGYDGIRTIGGLNHTTRSLGDKADMVDVTHFTVPDNRFSKDLGVKDTRKLKFMIGEQRMKETIRRKALARRRAGSLGKMF